MIINYLNKEELKLLRHVSYKKGDVIFNELEACDSIGIILNGVVKISSYSFQGKEINYNVLLKGHMFGNNLIFSNDNYYKGNVICQLDCEIAFLNKENLLYLLTHNRDFLLSYLNIEAELIKKMNSKIKILTFNNADERFLYYLNSNNNKIFLSSISSLAEYLNLSREALSRCINKLIRNKKISKKGNYIILNED
jgi:CRP-like cAMP-binding protein